MITVKRVYVQEGYSFEDHLKPETPVVREEFRSRTEAIEYYTKLYRPWAVGIIYYRRRNGKTEEVGYGPRTDGRVQDGMYTEFVP